MPTNQSAAARENPPGTKRYQLRRSLLALRNAFVIRNARGEVAYLARHRKLSFVAEIALSDPAHLELAFVRQKLWALGANYGIYRGGQHRATLKRTFSLSVRDHFTVFFVEPQPPMEVFCKFVYHGFEFFREGQSIAQIARPAFALTDRLEVAIQDGEDEVMILACTLAVYSAYH